MPIEKETVVVTGFGPFGVHKVNASWVGVQNLAERGLDDESVNLVTAEIPVVYEKAQKCIKELWERYNPVLMVHVGVSSIANVLTLEQQAHNDGYDKPDVEGLVPMSNCCVDDSCDQLIVSGINMGEVCQAVNEAGKNTQAAVSHDPNRFLCDFTYFTSLHINREISAFIHVPPLNDPYTASEMGEGLQLCVRLMLQQVRQVQS